MSKENVDIIKVDENATHYSITTDEAIIEIKHLPIQNAKIGEKPTIKTLDLPRAPGVPSAPDIPNTVMSDIEAMLDACINLITPYTTVFSSSELRKMRRIGMKSRPYFDIVVQYLSSNPDLCPPGLNIYTLKRFLEISYKVENLRARANTLNDMLKMIEAQFESLSYSIFTGIYNFIKVLAKEGNLVASELANIVKELFRKKKTETVTVAKIAVTEEKITAREE